MSEGLDAFTSMHQNPQVPTAPSRCITPYPVHLLCALLDAGLLCAPGTHTFCTPPLSIWSQCPSSHWRRDCRRYRCILVLVQQLSQQQCTVAYLPHLQTQIEPSVYTCSFIVGTCPAGVTVDDTSEGPRAPLPDRQCNVRGHHSLNSLSLAT